MIREHLQADGLARAGRARDEPVAVSHPRLNVDVAAIGRSGDHERLAHDPEPNANRTAPTMPRRAGDGGARRRHPLLEALHVGDEVVEVRRGQAAVLGRHRRLLRRVRLLGRFDRMRDPFFDLIGLQLRADAVEWIRLVALARDLVAERAFLRRVDRLALLGILRERRGCGRRTDRERDRAREKLRLERHRHLESSNGYQRYRRLIVPEFAVYGRYTYPITRELGCTMPLTTDGSSAKSNTENGSYR